MNGSIGQESQSRQTDGTLRLLLEYLVLPITVGLLILVGYFIGKQFGDSYYLLGIAIGGLLGITIGTIGFLHFLDGGDYDIR
jgi:hypothetical protein